jgi:hypothetical protein
MNKLLGFYALKSINIPTVKWKKFTRDTILDDGLLWTVRVALYKGDDTGLPRAVGKSAEEAMQMGREYLKKFSQKGMVVYYPYFIAEKSGVMDISYKRIIIEAVNNDLWNLVTHGNKDISVIIENTPLGEELHVSGSHNFLSADEISELKKYALILKNTVRDEISQGRSLITEWSYAYDTDTSGKPIGKRYLVFYELRSV